MLGGWHPQRPGSRGALGPSLCRCYVGSFTPTKPFAAVLRPKPLPARSGFLPHNAQWYGRSLRCLLAVWTGPKQGFGQRRVTGFSEVRWAAPGEYDVLIT